MNHSSAHVRSLRPWLAVTAFLFLLSGLVPTVEAARFYTPPSGKKMQHSMPRGYSEKKPFLNRRTSVKQYNGRLSQPPKNSSPYRRSNAWIWSAKRR